MLKQIAHHNNVNAISFEKYKQQKKPQMWLLTIWKVDIKITLELSRIQFVIFS